MMVNCMSAKRKKPCFVCGSLDHGAKQCSKAQDCFICKQSGHRAKDCPEKHKFGAQSSKICLKCGTSGHDMFLCEGEYSNDDLKGIQCYVCKNFGHLCCLNYVDTGRREQSCYKCGQLGHTGLACARLRQEASGEASPSSCYRCGKEGHFARECTNTAKMVFCTIFYLSEAPTHRLLPFVSCGNIKHLRSCRLIRGIVIQLPLLKDFIKNTGTTVETTPHPKFLTRLIKRGDPTMKKEALQHLRNQNREVAGQRNILGTPHEGSPERMVGGLPVLHLLRVIRFLLWLLTVPILVHNHIKIRTRFGMEPQYQMDQLNPFLIDIRHLGSVTSLMMELGETIIGGRTVDYVKAIGIHKLCFSRCNSWILKIWLRGPLKFLEETSAKEFGDFLGSVNEIRGRRIKIREEDHDVIRSPEVVEWFWTRV
ncbi:zinc finger CCHC domain-containing protein 7-like [Tripterygium wilfordii]|uniref:Zinc finger CCHC domain-containing protein 7-like n=1 Tax=Tripterygium wilfordii TaxID=458696 RepID=A0A7J7DZH8_TRIWF|nr:zinc finger CCHC domain-containing protein 7-like [Tripterygium wilfordii]